MNLDALLSYSQDIVREAFENGMSKTISLAAVGKLFVVFMVIALGISLLCRLFLGRNSSLSRSIATSICILVIYVVTVVVYILKPWSLDSLLSPLPYVYFCGEALIIHPFEGVSFNDFAGQALAMIIIAFLVNLSTSLVHSDSGVIRWLFAQLIAVVFAMLLHLSANWAIKTYVPMLYSRFASTLFFTLLVMGLLGGITKIILSIFLSTVHPAFGILYAFFFSNFIGKAITRAVLSTIIVTTVFSVIEYLGYAVIFISPSDLLSYIPLLLGLVILWYLIDHEL